MWRPPELQLSRVGAGPIQYNRVNRILMGVGETSLCRNFDAPLHNHHRIHIIHADHDV